jgi:hypothetical protein
MLKVVFLHIPKTAGTTLKTIMQRNYGAGEIANLYSQEVEKAEIEQQLNNPNTHLISGHFDFQPGFINPDLYTFTFLRSPIDRVISNYLHIKYSDTAIHKKWMEDVHEFPDFLKLPQGSNWQSRLLAGYKQRQPLDLETLFKEAISNLNSLNFIGLTEEFKHSLYCLSIDLNWVKIWFKNENTLADRSEFDQIKARFSDQIAAANEIDLNIYELGKKLYEKRWSKMTNLQRMQCRLRRMR